MTQDKLNLRLFDEEDDMQEDVIDPTVQPVSVEEEEEEDRSYLDDPAWQQYQQMHNARFAAKSAALARGCEKTAQIYPNFDLQKEMQNPRFLRLIDAGLSVQESYEALHRDELLQQAIAIAVEETRKAVYQKLAARKSRVEENGASPALMTRKDPASMSRHQREQIAKRVMRGEKVTF